MRLYSLDFGLYMAYIGLVLYVKIEDDTSRLIYVLRTLN